MVNKKIISCILASLCFWIGLQIEVRRELLALVFYIILPIVLITWGFDLTALAKRFMDREK